VVWGVSDGCGVPEDISLIVDLRDSLRQAFGDDALFALRIFPPLCRIPCTSLLVGARHGVEYFRHDAVGVCFVGPYTPIGELASNLQLGRIVEDFA